MNDTPTERIRQWARQTITFALSVENAPKTGVVKEVLEQNAITADRLAHRFLADAIDAAGDKDKFEVVLVEFVNRVLDWVVTKRKT